MLICAFGLCDNILFIKQIEMLSGGGTIDTLIQTTIFLTKDLYLYIYHILLNILYCCQLFSATLQFMPKPQTQLNANRIYLIQFQLCTTQKISPTILSSPLTKSKTKPSISLKIKQLKKLNTLLQNILQQRIDIENRFAKTLSLNNL